MLGFIKNLFKSDRALYDEQKKRLASGDARDLSELAASDKTHPEILYYLAKNGDAGQRKAVAENSATPVQASTLLATDRDVDVRFALAARLVRLLPDLSPEHHAQLYAYAVQALGTLAQDEVLSVRHALSATLKDYAKAPPAVVNKLARDVERDVAEPILRFCVALSDEDLLDILKNHPASWRVSAMASRDKVSPAVSQAIVDTGDVSGTTTLLTNKGAAFSPATLQRIIERAKDVPEWHKPMAVRVEVTMDVARQLAGFVDATVLSILENRTDFDPATRQGIAGIVKRRLDYLRDAKPGEPAIAKIERYIKNQNLTPEVIHDALTWHEDEFVLMALSVLSGIHPQVVKKMMGLGIAKPVVALCWKAKVPMRLCVELQAKMAKIKPDEMMYAKGGQDYPMSESDIKWQLEFFGVK